MMGHIFNMEKKLTAFTSIVWDKGRGGMGDLVGSYAPSYEMIIVAARGRNSLKNGGMIYCFSRWDVLGQWKNLIQFFGLEVRSCIVWENLS